MKLSLVVPCYNEQEALEQTARQLKVLMSDLQARGKINRESNVWLVDDGSKDATWPLIESLSRQEPLFVGLKLSRNRGHQNALLAGLFNADGEAVISLDADLQDDPKVIEDMVDAYRGGSEIVYGVRKSRERDTWFKKWSAQRYYGLLRSLGVEIVPDHADYRLMSQRAIEALRQYPETNLFLRGIVPLLGLKTAQVFYERASRVAGESKYPLRRMLAFAIDGITSFSAVPLRIIAGVGAFVFVVAMMISVWVLAVKLFSGRAVPGWASITLPLYGLGGIQLLSLGIVGEYVAKVYMETKRRPRFLVERIARYPESLVAAAAESRS